MASCADAGRGGAGAGGRSLRLAMVAGEPSGDLLGAGLLAALRAEGVAVEAEGIAGPRMQAEGCRPLHPMEDLSVMGLAEVALRYPALLPVRARLARRWSAARPDVFVGIDAPDFNLALERALHDAGVPVVHYVSPSVWAWRRYRIRRIARAVDRMLTLFPFETGVYREHAVAVTCVGHPLADRLRPEPDPLPARRALGLAGPGPVVALLPGSRVTEVARLAGPLVGAARWLGARRPDLRFVVPSATPRLRPLVERAIGADAAGFAVLDGRADRALAAADVALCASGTATLEALLIGRPMVITYRTLALTWRIGRPLLRVPHVGLPNLLAGRELVPELLQDEATPSRLGAAALQLLDTPGLGEALRAEMAAIRATLARGADRRAAGAVLEVARR